MSDKSRDGRPAFPVDTAIIGMQAGMSLRDWFAGKIISGICPDGFFSNDDAKIMAESAYRLADAMMKERERSK